MLGALRTAPCSASRKRRSTFFGGPLSAVRKSEKYRFREVSGEVHMIRTRLLGTFRTVLEYVVFVMGGTAILVMFARGLGILWSFNPEFVHPGFRVAFVSGFMYFYALLVYVPRVVVWGMVIPQIMSWVFVAALLYVCALLLAKTTSGTLIQRIALALISLYCSGRVIMFFSPTLLHDMASGYFTMIFAGLLGGVYGFFLFPRVRSESPQTSPMLLRHWIMAGAWILLFSANWGRSEYQLIKIRSTKDPQVELVFVKWSPGEGEVREELNKAIDPPFHYLTDFEIQELRAAGITGILRGCGGFGVLKQGRRFVVVISRPVRETMDLPKPASSDILYMQTEQGWKVFPPSAPTVARTLRLAFLDPTPTSNVATTNFSLDMGLGHPKGTPFSYGFSWLPEEFEAPLPSLPSPPSRSSSSP